MLQLAGRPGFLRKATFCLRLFSLRSFILISRAGLMGMAMVLTLVSTLGASLRVMASSAEVCQNSHLSLDGESASVRLLIEAELETVAHELAKFRLQSTQSDLSVVERNNRDADFKHKYTQFAARVGSEKKAKAIYQKEMRKARFDSLSHNAEKQQRARDKEQREKEFEIIDPTNPYHRGDFKQLTKGTFLMGKKDQMVLTEITEPFAMMDTAVTQFMWARIQTLLGERDPAILNPSADRKESDSVDFDMSGVQIGLRPDVPVVKVSFHQVEKFIHDLNELSKDPRPEIQKELKNIFPGHQLGDVYSLPTAEQWEYVLRDQGLANGEYVDRDDANEIQQYAWTAKDAKGYIQPVAQKRGRMANGHAFYDLEGNVSEWITGQPGRYLMGSIPVETQGIRGQSYTGAPEDFKTGDQYHSDAHTGRPTIGFRLIRRLP